MAKQQAAADDKPRRRLKAAERRESILAAAVGVFAEFGYPQAKTSMVAQRVGVSEPVVFQHFDSKAGLFAAVIERTTAQVCAIITRMEAERVPVDALLRAFLDPRHLEDVHTAGSIGAIFANATTVTGEPVIAAAAAASTQRFAEVLVELLERGKAAGQLRADLDAEAGAWWLLSLIAAQRFRAATAGERPDVETRLARATFEFLTGRSA